MTQVVQALKGEWPTYAVNPEGKARWMERWAGEIRTRRKGRLVEGVRYIQ